MRYKLLTVVAIAAPMAAASLAAQAQTLNGQFGGPGLVIYSVGQNYAANQDSNAMYDGTNSAYYTFSWPSGAQGSDISLSGQLPQGLTFQSVNSTDSSASDAIFGTPAAGTEGTYYLSLNGTVNGTATSYPFTLVIEPQSSMLTTIPDGITGNWFGGSSQSGHGFSIEVLPNSQLLAQWYTFTPSDGTNSGGTQAWINALGPITGNTATLQANEMGGAGGFFPPNFDTNNVQVQQWGTLTFTFYDCNFGLVTWDTSGTGSGSGSGSGNGSGGTGASGYGSGSMPIQRLTMPAGLTCSSTTQ